MRLHIVFLCNFLLAGCQALPGFNEWSRHEVPSVMPYWELYQRCLVTTEPKVLAEIIARFHNTKMRGVDPPAWVKALSRHAGEQPLRTAVHPEALGAACMLRAADAMIDVDRVTEAEEYYRLVLSRYTVPDLAYYRQCAEIGLDTIQRRTAALATQGRPNQPTDNL